MCPMMPSHGCMLGGCSSCSWPHWRGRTAPLRRQSRAGRLRRRQRPTGAGGSGELHVRFECCPTYRNWNCEIKCNLKNNIWKMRKRFVKTFWHLLWIVKTFWQLTLSTRPTTRYVTNELSKIVWQLTNELSKRFDNWQTNFFVKYQNYYTWLYKRNTVIIPVPYR